MLVSTWYKKPFPSLSGIIFTGQSTPETKDTLLLLLPRNRTPGGSTTVIPSGKTYVSLTVTSSRENGTPLNYLKEHLLPVFCYSNKKGIPTTLHPTQNRTMLGVKPLVVFQTRRHRSRHCYKSVGFPVCFQSVEGRRPSPHSQSRHLQVPEGSLPRIRVSSKSGGGPGTSGRRKGCVVPSKTVLHRVGVTL